MESETIDLVGQEMVSDVIYLPNINQYALLINNKVYRLDREKAVTLHNQFTTAVTQELLKRMGEND